jgi:integrase
MTFVACLPAFTIFAARDHRPYDLRHSYADWMLAAGVPAYDVAP